VYARLAVDFTDVFPQDILSGSTTLLSHFSSALSQYASHGHVMRDQLKAIRTREEALEELKRRRRTLMRKAEDAEKKLSKMSPEHKNLGMQTETLNRLRDEIRSMDSEIMTEEAALGDFKRTTTRTCMGLKFGGLLECCEKGAIVAEFGKMLIAVCCIYHQLSSTSYKTLYRKCRRKLRNLVFRVACIMDTVKPRALSQMLIDASMKLPSPQFHPLQLEIDNNIPRRLRLRYLSNLLASPFPVKIMDLTLEQCL